MAASVGFNGKFAVSSDGGSTYNDVSDMTSGDFDRTVSKTNCTSFDDAGQAKKVTTQAETSWSGSCNYNSGNAYQAAIRAASMSLTVLYYRWRPEGDTAGKRQHIFSGVPGFKTGNPVDGVINCDIDIEIENGVVESTIT